MTEEGTAEASRRFEAFLVFLHSPGHVYLDLRGMAVLDLATSSRDGRETLLGAFKIETLQPVHTKDTLSREMMVWLFKRKVPVRVLRCQVPESESQMAIDVAQQSPNLKLMDVIFEWESSMTNVSSDFVVEMVKGRHILTSIKIVGTYRDPYTSSTAWMDPNSSEHLAGSISDVAVNAIVHNCPLLTALEIPENNITDAALALLGEHCHLLRRLDMSGSESVGWGMTKEGIAALEARLPGLVLVCFSHPVYRGIHPSTVFSNCHNVHEVREGKYMHLSKYRRTR